MMRYIEKKLSGNFTAHPKLGVLLIKILLSTLNINGWTGLEKYHMG